VVWLEYRGSCAVRFVYVAHWMFAKMCLGLLFDLMWMFVVICLAFM